MIRNIGRNASPMNFKEVDRLLFISEYFDEHKKQHNSALQIDDILKNKQFLIKIEKIKIVHI